MKGTKETVQLTTKKVVMRMEQITATVELVIVEQATVTMEQAIATVELVIVEQATVTVELVIVEWNW